ncbi:uncharacterized protein NPIL_165431, partial [Nephila pilipes]
EAMYKIPGYDNYYGSPKSRRLGLYAEPPTRYIDEDTVPRDGSELIFQSQIENVLPEVPFLKASHYLQTNSIVFNPYSHEYQAFCRCVVGEFYDMRKTLMTLNLRENYPIDWELSNKDEKDWCLFCLGSELCFKIYPLGLSYTQPSKSRDPLLSLGCYLSQDEIMILIKYLFNWFQMIGMEHAIAKWLYVLLVLQKRYLNEEEEQFFETFRDECGKRLNSANSETMRLHLIYQIINDNFCAVKIVTSFPARAPINE